MSVATDSNERDVVDSANKGEEGRKNQGGWEKERMKSVPSRTMMQVEDETGPKGVGSGARPINSMAGGAKDECGEQATIWCLASGTLTIAIVWGAYTDTWSDGHHISDKIWERRAGESCCYSSLLSLQLCGCVSNG
jgi:hypothetical protein